MAISWNVTQVCWIKSPSRKPVISVTGAEKTTSKGQLRLVTIEVQPELTLFDG